MPQLDISTYASQIFWLALSFLLLFTLLSVFVLPRVKKVVVGREDKIADDLKQAESAGQEAEKAKQLYETALNKAHEGARSQVMAAYEETERDAVMAYSDLDETLDTKLQEAERKIQDKQREMMEKFLPVSAELAELVVEKILHIKPDSREVTKIVAALAQEKRERA